MTPVRVGRSEVRRKRAAFGYAEQRGLVHADSVEHRAHIVHALVEAGKFGDTSAAVATTRPAQSTLIPSVSVTRIS